MSLIDILLANRMILVVVGFAALLLSAAVLIAILPNIKLKRNKEKRQPEAVETGQAASTGKKRKKARGKRGRQAEPDEQPAAPAPVVQASAPARQPGEQQATPAEPEADATEGNASAPAQPGETAPQAAQPDDPPAESEQNEPEDKAASAIQSILDSVFEDEDQTARLEALLAGLEPVDISDLLSLAHEVAERLQEPYRG